MIRVANASKHNKGCKVQTVTLGLERMRETKLHKWLILAGGRRHSIIVVSMAIPKNSRQAVGQTDLPSARGMPKRLQMTQIH